MENLLFSINYLLSSSEKREVTITVTLLHCGSWITVATMQYAGVVKSLPKVRGTLVKEKNSNIYYNKHYLVILL